MGGVAKYHSAEKYVFLLLLFTAAVIPVNQVFTLLMVAVTFFAGMAVAVKYRKFKARACAAARAARGFYTCFWQLPGIRCAFRQIVPFRPIILATL